MTTARKKQPSRATLERKIRLLNETLRFHNDVVEAYRYLCQKGIDGQKALRAENERLADVVQQFKDRETDRAGVIIRELAQEAETDAWFAARPHLGRDGWQG